MAIIFLADLGGRRADRVARAREQDGRGVPALRILVAGRQSRFPTPRLLAEKLVEETRDDGGPRFRDRPPGVGLEVGAERSERDGSAVDHRDRFDRVGAVLSRAGGKEEQDGGRRGNPPARGRVSHAACRAITASRKSTRRSTVQSAGRETTPVGEAVAPAASTGSVASSAPRPKPLPPESDEETVKQVQQILYLLRYTRLHRLHR